MSPRSEQDMQGLTAPVTGASAGIGYETARLLARRGAGMLHELSAGAMSTVDAGGRWRGRRLPQPPPVKTTEVPAKQAKSRSPLTDSNRRPPPYHALEMAMARNPRQRLRLVLGVSARSRFATGCHRLQPRGSIKAPSLVGSRGNMRRRPPRFRASLVPSLLDRTLGRS